MTQQLAPPLPRAGRRSIHRWSRRREVGERRAEGCHKCQDSHLSTTSHNAAFCGNRPYGVWRRPERLHRERGDGHRCKRDSGPQAASAPVHAGQRRLGPARIRPHGLRRPAACRGVLPSLTYDRMRVRSVVFVIGGARRWASPGLVTGGPGMRNPRRIDRRIGGRWVGLERALPVLPPSGAVRRVGLEMQLELSV